MLALGAGELRHGLETISQTARQANPAIIRFASQLCRRYLQGFGFLISSDVSFPLTTKSL
jgi:hypothetical protein